MASVSVSEPPPAPSPTAVLDHLTSEEQAVKQTLPNPLGQLERAMASDQADSSSVQQTTALVVSQSQTPNTQSTATNCLLPYIDPKSEAGEGAKSTLSPSRGHQVSPSTCRKFLPGPPVETTTWTSGTGNKYSK